MILPIIAELLDTVPDDGQVVEDIHVYTNWVLTRARRHALNSIFYGVPGLDEPCHSQTWPGDCIGQSAKGVAESLLASRDALRLAAGMSLLNASLLLPDGLFDGNAIEVCAPLARRMRTVFIGHFVEGAQWHNSGWPVDIVEFLPRSGYIHWDESHAVLERAELVLISGLTLVNGHFHEVVRRCPKAIRVLLGPTVPPSPVFFNHGIHLVGSSLVADAEEAINYCRMGGDSIACAPEGVIRKVNLAHLDFPREREYVASTVA